eukprot:scaffold145645_cov32-Tisochrysis_lutea.AAC.2
MLLPPCQVISLIDDMRASMYSDRMQVIRDSFVERKPPRSRQKKKKLPEMVPADASEPIAEEATIDVGATSTQPASQSSD